MHLACWTGIAGFGALLCAALVHVGTDGLALCAGLAIPLVSVAAFYLNWVRSIWWLPARLELEEHRQARFLRLLDRLASHGLGTEHIAAQAILIERALQDHSSDRPSDLVAPAALLRDVVAIVKRGS